MDSRTTRDKSLENDIPTYRIDLSLPPSQQYTQLATDFAPRMKAITRLFDDVLSLVIPWPWLRRVIQFLASFLLRRVCSSEENDELKGISRASGVDMYFVVALNALLDSMLGCTSGGVLVHPRSNKMEREPSARMMHFRTLDWGMPELQSLLVQLEYVRSGSDDPECVVARSVTYAGFVGVLTGVRENLSMSLNFRPTHSCSTFVLRMHQLLVLLGFRQSVVSVLRNHLFVPEGRPLDIDDLTEIIKQTRTAPCYIILSSGQKTTVIEKDFRSGESRSAADFIAHTNHDVQTRDSSGTEGNQMSRTGGLVPDVVIEESKERKDCIQKKWESLHKRQTRARVRDGGGEEEVAVRESTLEKWVRAYPIMNECTHYGCILDPGTGTVRWIEKGELELEEDESE